MGPPIFSNPPPTNSGQVLSEERVSTLTQDVRQRLHAQGGRMTSQRRIICETLESLSGHPTAEDLFALVNERDPSINLSTIYRTLRWMEGEGLVSARRFDEDRRQERFDPAHPSEHHHFLCHACKRVIEFDNPLIDQVVASFEDDAGAKVENVSIVLYGLCSRCQQT